MEKQPNHAGLDSKQMTALRRYTFFFTGGAGVLSIVCLLVFLVEDDSVRYLALVASLAGAVLTGICIYVSLVGRRVT